MTLLLSEVRGAPKVKLGKGVTESWAGRDWAAHDDLDKLRLRGKRLSVDVRDSILADQSTISQSIDGATTITLAIHDPRRKLIRSGIFEDRVRLDVDDQQFICVGIGKQTPVYTVTFEPYVVWLLRQQRGYRRAIRGRVTRAQFGLSLIREPKGVRIPVNIPELRKVQPIAKARDRKPERKRRDNADRGLDPDTPLKFRGALADRGQLDLAERALDVADSLGADRRVQIALGMCGINETAFRNTEGSSDGLSDGMLQLQTKLAGGTDTRDPEAQVYHFLMKGAAIDQGAIAYAKAHPSATPAEIVRAVWGGTGFPLSTWTRWRDEAVALVDAYQGDGSSRTFNFSKPYLFERERGEDTWEALRRLFEEVGWRRFERNGRIWLVAEADLVDRQKPRFRIREGDDGILQIDWRRRQGHKTQEVTVTCRIDRWQAPPGTVVVVDGEGKDADGRYLVTQIDRPPLNAQATVTLKRPQREKPEPAADVETVTVGGGSGSGGDRVDAMIAWAKSTLGTREGTSRQVMWAREFGLSPTLPWCSIWIAFGIKRVAGLPVPPNPAYSGAWLTWSAGKRVSVDKVQAGDIVVFDWGDGGITDHVALYVGGGDVIGGNQSDNVTRVPLNRGAVVGVVRPGYGAR